MSRTKLSTQGALALGDRRRSRGVRGRRRRLWSSSRGSCSSTCASNDAIPSTRPGDTSRAAPSRADRRAGRGDHAADLRPHRSTCWRGSFVSHEHTTTGSVRVIEHPDGTRQLAIVGLETSNGPDVHVWLSAGPVIEGFDGWFTAAGYEYIDLGPIKGNLGDQLYDIPAGVDLERLPHRRSVVRAVRGLVRRRGAGVTLARRRSASPRRPVESGFYPHDIRGRQP